jgi:hypothetical protein
VSTDDRVAVLALVDGESSVRSATVIHRDHTMLHVSSDEPLPLPVGDVVGLMSQATTEDTIAGAVTLALVTESVGPTITVLRLLERRA